MHRPKQRPPAIPKATPASIVPTACLCPGSLIPMLTRQEGQAFTRPPHTRRKHGWRGNSSNAAAVCSVLGAQCPLRGRFGLNGVDARVVPLCPWGLDLESQVLVSWLRSRFSRDSPGFHPLPLSTGASKRASPCLVVPSVTPYPNCPFPPPLNPSIVRCPPTNPRSPALAASLPVPPATRPPSMPGIPPTGAS